METEDPVEYVRSFIKDDNACLTVDEKPGGVVTVYTVAEGMTQKFIFTPLNVTFGQKGAYIGRTIRKERVKLDDDQIVDLYLPRKESAIARIPGICL